VMAVFGHAAVAFRCVVVVDDCRGLQDMSLHLVRISKKILERRKKPSEGLASLSLLLLSLFKCRC
jgi:hypothetical protein